MFAQRLTVAAAAALTLLSISACSTESGPTLTAPEAFEKHQNGQLTLIDIRRPDEWRKTGVADGALRINMVHPQGASGFVQQVSAELDGQRDTPIGLICRTGNRTTHMQKALREAGFTQVYNIKEGMVGSGAGPGWVARGLPVEPCKTC
ncbi:MAG: rhodanese-like domain-containing protein [Thiobacillus sp.]|uniref:rhodanese-like domain-containing protein n=1 Tax=Thiobacillus sp. TaxID=924 RepID=UPI002733B9DE|nr:rhodanese-like domain-containing protein [Thiobacillus sp.]MDP3420494.1 rhodanese-like domain-containing protein [Thiobacillus sp.]MDP3586005.1 rhodanese-like domain-containing protein [Thiobacillus sp.]